MRDYGNSMYAVNYGKKDYNQVKFWYYDKLRDDYKEEKKAHWKIHFNEDETDG